MCALLVRMSPMLIADLVARPRATDAVYLMVRPDPPAAKQFSNLGRRLCQQSQSIDPLIEADRLHTTCSMSVLSDD
jgi:hypothetical protein